MKSLTPLGVLTVGVMLVVLPAAVAQQQGGQQPGGTYGNWLPGSGNKKQDKESANTRAVQGSVKTPDENVAEGAVVQIKNTKTMQVRSFITKADGIFTFSGLSTAVDYELKATFRGMESAVRTVSTFDDRKRVIVNLRLEPKK
ncbi:MAG: carboxypeptidase-like regulatory domain-containing protein [Acidobacteria bacterium]|nr:carboxypeptidase-like regulatory domain-containing protein [Acidobacteriota bacterium]